MADQIPPSVPLEGRKTGVLEHFARQAPERSVVLHDEECAS